MKGAIKLKGLDKSTDLVYVQRGKEIHTRRRPKPGAHRDDKVLRENYLAAASVNELAGSINRVFKTYASGDIEMRIYPALLSAVRKAQHPARIVRLMNLEGLNGHSRNALEDVIEPKLINLVAKKNKIAVELNIEHHAKLEKDLKFYYVQLVLMLWNKNGKYSHAENFTEWLTAKERLPLEFNFEFDKPAGSTDYLLMCCCVRGEEAGEDRLPPKRTIRIVKAGSFDKHARAILEKYRATAKAGEKITKLPVQRPAPVAPKRT